MSHPNLFRKQPSRLTMPVRLGVAAVAACFLSAPVLSNPLNPTVVNGAATFNQAGKVLTVTNTPGAIINWQKFSIQAGETTHFAQTAASSSVLNRVLNDPTAIYGTLSSNGRVWLVNPAGIMVGPGGKVDVAAFVASTLNISNADFLAGRNVFINDGTAKNVINQGEIRTPAGGSVYLIGSNVTNEGIITTPKGETILAAGATVSLIDSATPGVKVDITGSEGNATNLGTLTAEAGRIGIAGVIVRNSGTVNASSVVSEGGRIFLKASQDAYVDGNGQITATGTRGGQVEVLGERIAVTGKADIDASGTGEADAGGGRIMVGGDYQGKNPDVQNANVSYFGPDATLKADAGKVGDGGTVIVWSDDTTRAYGSISARGGEAGGNGGFVETSGHSLDVSGARVRADAPNGATGQWLLDPINVTISATVDAGGALAGGIWTPSATGSTITNTTIQTALGGGTSVTITTTGGLAEAGNITVSAPIGPTGATPATLTLQADNDINVNAEIGTAGARFNHGLSLNAGNRIGINSPIYLSNTLLSATAPAIDLNAVMDVGTGTVSLSSTGTVTQSTTLPAAISAGVLELLGVGGAHTLTHAGNQVGEVRMNTGSVVLTNNGTTLVNGFPAPGAGQESILAAATPVAGEKLGIAISVNGNVMVVGAPGAFMSGQGAAYVYRWNGSAWVFEARLTAPGTINFGTSVTVEGNYIVVGAPETADGAYRSGAAYPFAWNGTSWVAGTKLSFADKVFESTFGTAVAIDNGRLVVGGGGRTSEGGFWTGKIWFYDLVSGAWVERGRARQSDPQDNDYFGLNLDISGNRMIVSAPNGPASGTAGKAYIFEFNPTTRVWTQTQKLTQTTGVVADYFGSNVSISGDVAIVGANRAAPGAKTNAGSLYAFRYNGTNWAVEQIITPTDQAVGDLFGTGVRVRDGVIVAASYGADLPGKVDAGAGYVFKYNGTLWLQDAKITATTPLAGDLFGYSAILADQRLFFGAYGADPSGVSGSGAAYAYDPLVSSTLAGSLTVTSAGALTQAVPVNAGGVVSYKSGSDIAINAALNAAAGNSVMLRADSNGSCLYNGAVCGTVLFGAGGSVATSGGGRTDIYYNPGSYASPTVYSSHVTGTYTAWMLVNDVGAESGGARGLQAMGTNLGGNYALGRDVDASATSGWNSSAGFVPIGNNTANFGGKFDGLGHVITGLRVNRPSESGMGLFGYVGSGEISNVGLVGGSVVGEFFVGGLVGANNSGTISNSYATGSASGNSYVGGLVGGNYYGSVSNSYAAGSVSAINNTAGGLVGENYYGSVSNSYAADSVAGNTYIGGLVGANNYGTVSSSYSTGMVTGNAGVGGLAGVSSGTVDSSFWDTQTSGQATSAGGTGKTTAEMQTAATFTGAGWSATVWNIADGAYPTLKNMPAPPPPPVPCVGYDNCWTGAVNSFWATGSNWTAGHAPTGSESAKVDVAGTPTILITGINPSFGSLWLAENLNVDASVGFVLNNLFTLNAGTATFNGTASVHGYVQTGGTLAGSGAFTVTNNFAQTGGAIDRVGDMTISQAAGTLNFAATRVGSLVFNANAINLGQVSANGYIWAEADGDLAVNGPLSAATSSVHLFAGLAYDGALTVNNAITAATNVELDNKRGTIAQTAGTIQVGTATTSSTYNVRIVNDYATAPDNASISLNSITIDPAANWKKVLVASRGAILDNNGTAGNISTSGEIVLTSSYGGNPGGLAISADIAGLPTRISASVNGGTYGGVRLNKLGDLPGTPLDIDTFGDLSIKATGNFDTSGLSLPTDPANLLLEAGGNLTVTTDLWSPGMTQLAANNMLTITSDGVVQGGTVLLSAPAVHNNGWVWSQGNTQVYANDYVSNGGEIRTLDFAADVDAVIGNDMTLYGAEIVAGHDVKLSFQGPSSTLSLNTGSRIEAEAPDTIYLNFLGRSSGGILIDGVEAGTADFGTIFFNAGLPASLDDRLFILYTGTGGSTIIDPCALSPDLCAPPVPITSPMLEVVKLPEADPCTTAPDSAQCKALKMEDEKEKQENDDFGKDDGDRKEKSGKRKPAQCGI